MQYLTRDGAATAGEDYTQTRGTLTFAVGETEKTVSAPILDDALDEGEETFTLKLRNTRSAPAWLGLSHRTLESYWVSGRGPAFHRFGNRVRCRRLGLDACAQTRCAVMAAQANRLRPA